MILAFEALVKNFKELNLFGCSQQANYRNVICQQQKKSWTENIHNWVWSYFSTKNLLKLFLKLFFLVTVTKSLLCDPYPQGTVLLQKSVKTTLLFSGCLQFTSWFRSSIQSVALQLEFPRQCCCCSVSSIFRNRCSSFSLPTTYFDKFTCATSFLTEPVCCGRNY